MAAGAGAGAVDVVFVEAVGTVTEAEGVDAAGVEAAGAIGPVFAVVAGGTGAGAAGTAIDGKALPLAALTCERS